ncbi:MAG TPA: glycosyltransferase [Gaiellaceae bacterium]|nr:glycosyltransferase [Gaiellaceae bacterium]
MRVLVAGASVEEICGTRDAAQTLAGPLERQGLELRTAWWERREQPFADWARRLRDESADAVLWHYSPFTYATAGLPLYVPRTLRALGTAPLVPLFHELVYPWGRGGARGALWAAGHHAALRLVLRRAAGSVVTTDDRRASLERMRPRRPVLVAPVVSNIAPPAAPATAGERTRRIGVFGFRRGTGSVALLVEAVAPLLRSDPDARLVLVGAPGPDGPEAQEWRSRAETAGIAGSLELTGVLAPERLSHELSRLDLVLFPDPVGPTSRRGTLAAVLAHGRPTLAFHGPQTWDALVAEGAVELAPYDREALAAAVVRLAADGGRRAALGARARAFHDSRLAVDVVAGRIAAFLREAAGR